MTDDAYLMLFAKIRNILRNESYAEQAKLSTIRQLIDREDKSLTLTEQWRISELENPNK